MNIIGLRPYNIMIYVVSPSTPNYSAHFFICSAALSSRPLVAHYLSNTLDRFGILMYSSKEGKAEFVKYYSTRD